MTDYNNPNIRRELIMKHYSAPDNKEKIEKPNLSHYSNHCVDELHIKWEFSSNRLKSIKWDGIGCAVFQSSTDIFINQIKNKEKNEILRVSIEYENLINNNGEFFDERNLGDLMIFKNVKSQLNRLNCANMISQLMIKELK